MCDIGIQPMEAPEAREVFETADVQELDTATFEPRSYVEAISDYKQAEDIQRDFSAVAENLGDQGSRIEVVGGLPAGSGQEQDAPSGSQSPTAAAESQGISQPAMPVESQPESSAQEGIKADRGGIPAEAPADSGAEAGATVSQGEASDKAQPGPGGTTPLDWDEIQTVGEVQPPAGTSAENVQSAVQGELDAAASQGPSSPSDVEIRATMPPAESTSETTQTGGPEEVGVETETSEEQPGPGGYSEIGPADEIETIGTLKPAAGTTASDIKIAQEAEQEEAEVGMPSSPADIYARATAEPGTAPTWEDEASKEPRGGPEEISSDYGAPEDLGIGYDKASTATGTISTAGIELGDVSGADDHGAAMADSETETSAADAAHGTTSGAGGLIQGERPSESTSQPNLSQGSGGNPSGTDLGPDEIETTGTNEFGGPDAEAYDANAGRTESVAASSVGLTGASAETSGPREGGGTHPDSNVSSTPEAAGLAPTSGGEIGPEIGSTEGSGQQQGGGSGDTGATVDGGAGASGDMGGGSGDTGATVDGGAGATGEMGGGSGDTGATVDGGAGATGEMGGGSGDTGATVDGGAGATGEMGGGSGDTGATVDGGAGATGDMGGSSGETGATVDGGAGATGEMGGGSGETGATVDGGAGATGEMGGEMGDSGATADALPGTTSEVGGEGDSGGGEAGSGDEGTGGSDTGSSGSSGGDDGGDEDGGGDEDDGGDDEEGSDEDTGSSEGMTVDGGSGEEPGRRQGSILGGSIPSGGGETQDTVQKEGILGGVDTGGFSGDTGGNDTGGQERQPISGGTKTYADSGGAQPIDPVRAAADLQAAQQLQQQQQLNADQQKKTGTG